MCNQLQILLMLMAGFSVIGAGPWIRLPYYYRSGIMQNCSTEHTDMYRDCQCLN